MTQNICLELAVIIDDPYGHPDPSPTTLLKYNDERIQNINLHISLVEAKEAKETTSTGRAMSDEALRIRKAREQKKALEKAKAAGASTERSDSLFMPESSSSPTPATPAYTVAVPSSSSALQWYAPHKGTHTTLAGARAAGVWTHPSTLHERAKCGVFAGLWEQGFFMGGGIKFGGDYLVYPGL